jgi:hypothetical protein
MVTAAYYARVIKVIDVYSAAVSKVNVKHFASVSKLI